MGAFIIELSTEIKSFIQTDKITTNIVSEKYENVYILKPFVIWV